MIALARLLLRLERHRLEWGIAQPFDRRRSLRLDRVIVALEALA